MNRNKMICCAWLITVSVSILPSTSGLKCFVCAGCSDGGETVSNPEYMEDCPGGLCLSSRLIENEPYGTQRRSCTNATLGISGTCELTPFTPKDNHFERRDYKSNSSMAKTCYCSNVDGCNSSNLIGVPIFLITIICLCSILYGTLSV